ncbi:acetyl-CoA C-acyltransferase [Trinickia symbiotica]|uniref:Acetyl-CoA C-acyltransferase n=1 Tax=Trinickia symbiotica TaxID=863227 RepID=A0A2T3XQM9_9BURK|nr:beta-ketothiolase BktB [Trinickia symbiotica]PTB18831.1 acetyl-CoA C-acyltransferase [Trinickia symbiotica]
MQDEVVVTAAVRTAIGDFGGALASVPPTQLGATVVRALLDRTSLQGSEVGHVVFGNVIHTEPRDMYLSRVAALEGGVSADAPALTLNRLCGSGLQAIISAAQAIALGDTEVAIGGGAENMSRAAYVATSARWGSRMGDIRLIDMMVGALTDPFSDCHMGVTAENVAKKWGISRDDQDRLAVESHRRAADAIRDGRFQEQIVPVTLRTKKGESVFDTDEHVRAGTTIEDLAKLRPAFQKDGTVTAGNASGLNDGAAAVLLMTRRSAEQRGIRPLARLVSYAQAGVDPQYMGIGPVPAARKALLRAGLSVADIDVIEANEAFAAQACAVAKELEFDSAKVNPNGSGISLGHPIGATGAAITVKAIHELQRCGGRYALVTMCIGGGQGIAAVFERI